MNVIGSILEDVFCGRFDIRSVQIMFIIIDFNNGDILWSVSNVSVRFDIIIWGSIVND